MRRTAPRPVATALDRLTAALAPATLLAEVQRAWPAAAGDAFAACLAAMVSSRHQEIRNPQCKLPCLGHGVHALSIRYRASEKPHARLSHVAS